MHPFVLAACLPGIVCSKVCMYAVGVCFVAAGVERVGCTHGHNSPAVWLPGFPALAAPAPHACVCSIIQQPCVVDGRGQKGIPESWLCQCVCTAKPVKCARMHVVARGLMVFFYWIAANDCHLRASRHQYSTHYDKCAGICVTTQLPPPHPWTHGPAWHGGWEGHGHFVQNTSLTRVPPPGQTDPLGVVQHPVKADYCSTSPF
jgi:hypothetical protein